MRAWMAAETDARVLLGGKLSGYMGRYPGIAEEALLSLRAGKPIYLLGGFGGCARALADAVMGRKPAALIREFQERDPAYREMVAAHDAIPGVDPVDYEGLVGELERLGLGGLSALRAVHVRLAHDLDVRFARR